jgi:hypothetical protein
MVILESYMTAKILENSVSPENPISFHAQRLEHRIHRIRVEAGLELRKQLARNCGKSVTLDIGNRIRFAPASNATCRLSARFRACVIVPPSDISPITTIWLCTGLPSAAEHNTMKLASVNASGVPAVLQFNHVQVEITLGRVDGCAHAAALALK